MSESWLDIQHRGFGHYSTQVCQTEIGSYWNRLMQSAAGSDYIATILTDCEVITDWIEQIEYALPYIEKALQQNRQFLLRQGETVPIDKARHVSKESVTHLARHSQLINTLPPPEEPLIPEKIYVTENTSTYAVYENRFLYMLLCLIRDFTDYRHQRIRSMTAHFSANMQLSKTLRTQDRAISCRLEFCEESNQLERPANDQLQLAILRISGILQAVELMLRTELMQNVALAPLLKPPISRTNVMLHDVNFQEAFKLYSFLTEYSGDGFHIVEQIRKIGAFDTQMQQDMAQWLALTSYLPYRSCLLPQLEARYQALEAHRQMLEDQAKQAHLAQLKQHIGSNPEAAMAYIVALEQRNVDLEKRQQAYALEKTAMVQAQQQLAATLEQKEKLCAQLPALENKISQQKQQMTKMQGQINQSAAKLEQQQRQHAAELEKQKQQDLQKFEELNQQYRLAKARLHTQEQPNPEGCSKESFAELEAEYQAFQRYFEKQWKLTKKQIRKEMLWNKKKDNDQP